MKSACIHTVAIAAISLVACSPASPAPPSIASVTVSPSPAQPGGTVTVTAAATDSANVGLTYSWTAPTGWTVVGPSNEPVIVLTAPSTFGQTAVIPVIVSAGQKGSATSQAVLSTTTEPAPTITGIMVGQNPILPGGTTTLVATASGPASSTLTYQWTASETGWTVTGSGGSAVVTAPSTFSSSTVITLAVSDSGGGSASATVIVSTPADSGPTVSSLVAAPVTVNPGGTATLAAVASSPAQSALTFAWATSDPTWTIAGTGVTATLTAPSTYYASTAITVTATDANGLAASRTIPVSTSVDPGPVLDSLTATPATVAPGGTSTLVAHATGPSGSPLAFAWTSSDADWIVSGTGNAVIITAPTMNSSSTVVTLTVTDMNGIATSRSVAVTTSADSAGIVTSIVSVPTNPKVGEPVTLSAIATLAASASAQFAWTLLSRPTGSTLTNTATTPTDTLTPDAVGSYTLEVVITDANGVSTPPFTAAITAANPAPHAVIMGAQPFTGAFSSPVAIDASGSTTPTGNPLQFQWAAISYPAGASVGFFANTAEAIVGPTQPKTFFVGSLPGNYVVSMTVTDALLALSTTVSANVTLFGAGSLAVASGGGNQSAVARNFLPSPVVLRLLGTDGATPLVGQLIKTMTSDGTVSADVFSTDSNGEVTFAVQAGRIAGAGSLVAWLSGNAFISASVPFAVTADAAASISVATSRADADMGGTITVQVVDQWGNPAADNTNANSATLKASLSSPSGNAAFPAGGGSSAGVTLAGGKAQLAFTDTTAETVSVTLGQGSSVSPLPFSGWTTQIQDSGAAGLGAWTASTSVMSPGWAVETAASEVNSTAGDVTSLGVFLNPSQAIATGVSQLARTVSGGSVVLLEFNYEATVPSALIPSAACADQVALYATMLNGTNTSSGEYSDSSGSPIVPAGGYPAFDLCGRHLSFTTTSGWTAATYDVTDAYNGGFGDLALIVSSVAGGSDLAKAANWDVDDIVVKSLSAPSFTPAAIPANVLAGAATTVTFTQSSFGGGTIFRTCEPGVSISVQETDKNGNVVPESAIVEIDWTSGTLQPSGVTVGTFVQAVNGALQVQLAGGNATVTFDDSVSETATLDLKAITAGLAPGGISTATAQPSFCHSDGFGGQWSDPSTGATYTNAEALNACQNVYGLGTCSTSGASFTYRNQTANCRDNDVWYFSATTFTDSCSGTTSHFASGATDVAEWSVGCACSAGNDGAASYRSCAVNGAGLQCPGSLAVWQ